MIIQPAFCFLFLSQTNQWLTVVPKFEIKKNKKNGYYYEVDQVSCETSLDRLFSLWAEHKQNSRALSHQVS